MNKEKGRAIPKEKIINYIDIEQAIGEKNPTLLKLLPNFLINYIKKIIHQDELNKAITDHNHRYHLDFVDAAMEVFGPTTSAKGIENIPKDGGVFMTANHPLGGLEAIAMMKVVGSVREDIKFLVNDLLMAIKNFDTIFIPVNKHGKNTKEYMESINKTFGSDDCLLIFPAGLVSRLQDDKTIQDLTWKRSFVEKAVLHKKNVIPVHIDGRNSNFFYNLGYWRKKLGIKANLEMFFLADELFSQKGKNISFIFGKPISWETFTPDKPSEYWSEKVRQHVYALKSGDKSKLLPTI